MAPRKSDAYYERMLALMDEEDAKRDAELEEFIRFTDDLGEVVDRLGLVVPTDGEFRLPIQFVANGDPERAGEVDSLPRHKTGELGTTRVPTDEGKTQTSTATRAAQGDAVPHRGREEDPTLEDVLANLREAQSSYAFRIMAQTFSQDRLNITTDMGQDVSKQERSASDVCEEDWSGASGPLQYLNDDDLERGQLPLNRSERARSPLMRGFDGTNDDAGAEIENEEEPSLPRQKSLYSQLFRDGGRRMLSIAVYENEKDFHRSIVGDFSIDLWHAIAMPILLSTEDALLEAILEGNLHRAMQQNPTLRKHVQGLMRQSRDQYDNYMFEFVDANGFAPSPVRMLKIIDIAEQYAENDEAAWEIVRRVDNWMGSKGWAEFKEADMKRGKRRYLPTKPAPGKLRALLRNMRSMLAEEPQNEPLSQPLREVGYTNNGPGRIGEHERHQGSNWLMNLFEAIAAQWFNWDYRNRGHVIYLCFERNQGSAGEILWSSLSSAYTKTGRGFSHTPAGASNRSIEDDSVTFKKWVEWTNKAWHDSPFQANYQRERDMAAAARAEEKQLIEEDQRLDEEERRRMNSCDKGGELLQLGESQAGMDDAVEELCRMVETDFVSDEARVAADEKIRSDLARQLAVWETLASDSGDMLDILRSMHRRLQDQEAEELYE